MKYTVTVKNKTYEVEIGSLNTRPIVARIDGEQFEIYPINGQLAASRMKQLEGSRVEKKNTLSPYPATAATPAVNPASRGDTLSAPLPGTVIDVFVKPGDQVEAGQVVLVIEAMKMKNSIRSVWSGVIGEVLVNTGQTVSHKQALIKFAQP